MTSSAGASDDDRRHLDRARRIARKGWGQVHPNPLVGCVLVREDRVVGEGHHERYGGRHAERMALDDAGEEARGATAYVTLEPCRHHGKTPPCTRALLDAGVARVVYGANDPGPRSSGGARVLEEAGVEVMGPVLSPEEARRDNPDFFHNASEDLPYVATKLAVSLDGYLATAPGHRTALTGPEALARVHELRAGFLGILVGSRTVEVDDPLLTVRGGREPRRPPWRLVVDTEATTDPGARLFDDADRVPVVVFTAEDPDPERVAALEAAGARVVPRPPAPGGVDLTSVLEWCRTEGVHSVLCEGGGVLASSLLAGGLCQRLVLHLAPRVLGSGGVPAFPTKEDADLLAGWRVVEAEAGVGADGIVVLEPDRSEPEEPS